jgi:hypothetical protein
MKAPLVLAFGLFYLASCCAMSSPLPGGRADVNQVLTQYCRALKSGSTKELFDMLAPDFNQTDTLGHKLADRESFSRGRSAFVRKQRLDVKLNTALLSGGIAKAASTITVGPINGGGVTGVFETVTLALVRGSWRIQRIRWDGSLIACGPLDDE